MALVRKIRKVGHSLTVVIPAHLAAMVDFEEGDEIESEPGRGDVAAQEGRVMWKAKERDVEYREYHG